MMYSAAISTSFASLILVAHAEESFIGSTKIAVAPKKRRGIRGGPSRFVLPDKHVNTEQQRRSHGRDIFAVTSKSVSSNSDHPQRNEDVGPAAPATLGSVDVKATAGPGMYYEPIQIGSQNLLMDFDTGSPLIFVETPDTAFDVSSGVVGVSENKDGAVGTPGTLGGVAQVIVADNASLSRTLYVAAKDPDHSTDVKTDMSPNIGYGTGTVLGSWFKTKIGLGKLTFDHMVISTSWITPGFVQSFVEMGSAGVFGLAPPNSSATSMQDQTFVGQLAGRLTNPVFTVDLNEKGGTYHFGDIDQRDYSGAITYADVRSGAQPYWDLEASSFTFESNGKALPAAATNAMLIPDTGSTLITMPKDMAVQYYKNVADAKGPDKSGLWDVPCGSSVPPLEITLKGAPKPLSIPLTPWQDDSYSPPLCNGPISVSSDGTIILGDVFFQQAFVVFNGAPNAAGKYSVGFAAKVKA